MILILYLGNKKNMEKGKLYLIPVELAPEGFPISLPAANHEIIKGIRHFIVEELRTARRFLKRCNPAISIDETLFYELNEHTRETDVAHYLNPARDGFHIGLLSEAGIPCIADPGNIIVRMAHHSGIQVVPLTGPSSLFLALAASGLNGQHFCFDGYLPVKPLDRNEKLKAVEKDIFTSGKTHLFIEAPYRNNALFEALVKQCHPETMLCIACGITSSEEWILTLPIKEWRKKKPDIQKRPAVFLLGK